jgi:hypothetical protein
MKKERLNDERMVGQVEKLVDNMYGVKTMFKDASVFPDIVISKRKFLKKRIKPGILFTQKPGKCTKI